MPSQEDYLDNLLKDMTANEEMQEADSMSEHSLENNDEQEYPVDLDSVSNMTEEEIEQLLSAGTQTDDTLLEASDMDLSDEDVLKMLEESDEQDLKDIQELLEKSDRNEAVDDSIEKLLREPEEENHPGSEAFGEAEEKEAFRKEEKKKAAQEKRELARAKREEKKKQAAEKKAEKKAARDAAREAKSAEKKANSVKQKVRKKSEQGQPAHEEQPEHEEQFSEGTDEDLFDMSILDSIVSDADKETAGNGEEEFSIENTAMEELPQEQLDEEPVDVFAQEMDQVPMEEEPSKEESPLKEEDENLGIDLGSLFGDGDVDGSLSEEVGDSDFPDFVALDADEADAFIPSYDKEPSYEETPKKKKGFFSKILDFLTEEDEDEENENIKLSQENRDILNEIDNETEEGKTKKKKKPKKEKGEKEKKDKPKKEPKAKKATKPKKEKPLKEVPLFPEKKLSFKKVLPIILIGVSVGVLLFVFVNSATDYSDKKTARKAYYEGDYQTCYQNLFGKELDETESIMFGKSESILYIRLWIREYEMFAEEGAEVEALDSLIQTVAAYPNLYEYANQWNAGSEVAAGYATVLNILADKYGLTEREALEIAAEPSDVEYTKMVTAIAEGKSYDSTKNTEEETMPNPPIEPEETMQDMLPEEKELGNDTYIDNRKDGEPEE